MLLFSAVHLEMMLVDYVVKIELSVTLKTEDDGMR